ncbi:MAG: high-potential iron-sulfur protein [Novosphingobium sp.]|nr:high-potential iron-sulfur protein [Novosphingobium sp.]
MPDRRSLLAIGLLAPFVLTHTAKAQTTCVGSLSMSDRNRRRALGYVEASKSRDRRCGLCTFFTATEGACGTCQMLSGQPVDAAAVCNSFVVKGQ